MSANVPTDIRFSFAGLARRGGGAGPHRDGWGIAFYEGRSARAFHDPEPAASSDIARFVGSHPIKSRTVIAHIRQANRGRVTLANTHPFSRELWGRVWTFAHNGQLRGRRRPCRSISTARSAPPTASTPSAGCSTSCARGSNPCPRRRSSTAKFSS